MFTRKNKRHNLFTEWKKACTHLLGKAKKKLSQTTKQGY